MKTKGMKVTGILAGVVILTFAALPHLVDIDRFRPELESGLSSTLGREVHVGHMELSLLAGGARVNQISVADDPAYSSSTFLQAKSLGVGVSLLSLIFSRSVHVTSLTLDEPRLMAIQSPTGEWNFSSLGAASKSEDDPAKGGLATVDRSVVLDRLKISNATIEVVSNSGKGQATTLKNVSADLKNVSFDEEMSFALSAKTDAGEMEIKGEAGPMNRAHPEQTPFHADIKADKADLAQIAALGTSSPLAGILNLDGTVTSDGGTIHSEGKASADKLRLVSGAQAARQTVSLRYETDYNVAQKNGVIRNGEIGAGKSTASLSGTYDAHGKNLVVHMKIAGSQLPLDSVEGVLPALGIALPGGSKIHGGTVNANLSIDGPVDRVVSSGNAQIANAHLAGFDLGSKLSSLPGMSAAKGSTDLSISKLGTNLRIGPDGTHISGFDGEFAGIGSITGDGDVSASNHLQFKMTAHVAGDGAVRFGLNHVGLKNVPNEIPFQVVGTTSMPVIIPDLSGMAKNSAKSLATNAAKSQVKKFVTNAKDPAVAQQANNKKSGGFFHKLFGHKDKQTSAANSTQLASQKTRY
jgi:AsmA protein